MARKEIPGFCHLATKDEIVSNDYNLNIPRYIDNTVEDSGGDVEAHLLGGIPETDIKNLFVLNELASEIIKKNFSILRKGYLKFENTVEDFSNQIINSNGVQNNIKEVKNLIQDYGTKYFEIIKKFEKGSNSKRINNLKNQMLSDIMSLISKYNFIDDYEAYQLIADLWKNYLTKDFVYIAETGFYEAGRTVIPNMITKGQGKDKHEEQDGVKGAIIPNDLVSKVLYSDMHKEMNELQKKVLQHEEKLSQYLEDNQDDGNDNAGLLDEALNAAEDGITKTKLSTLIKLNNSNKAFYEEVLKVLNEKSIAEKALKAKQKELKEKVMERIPLLNNDEIDLLMNQKWFASLQKEAETLILNPVERELVKVKNLYNDYGFTLKDIDNSISSTEKIIEEMKSQLVVTE